MNMLKMVAIQKYRCRLEQSSLPFGRRMMMMMYQSLNLMMMSRYLIPVQVQKGKKNIIQEYI